jgi:hypothetical protein
MSSTLFRDCSKNVRVVTGKSALKACQKFTKFTSVTLNKPVSTESIQNSLMSSANKSAIPMLRWQQML